MLTAIGIIFWNCALAQAPSFDAEPINAFGYPQTDAIKVIKPHQQNNKTETAPKPLCDNPKLITQARQAIKSVLDANPVKISDKRRNKLIIKNFAEFSPVLPQDNSISKEILARLVEVGINHHISRDNVAICQSENKAYGGKIYLFIYGLKNDIYVEILGFSGQQTPKFIFKDE